MILFIISGALMLGTCIFIHEIGHLLLGRTVGVKAEIFSIGYGKGIWKKKIGVTTWQITAFPIGGYVKFYGDQLSDRKKNIPGGFFSVPPLQRIIPVLGGPLFNLLLGLFLFILLHSLSGPVAPRIQTLPEDTSSSILRSGLRDGDLVKKINDKPVYSFMELSQAVALSGGKPLSFEVERKGKIHVKEVIPDILPSGTGRVGIRLPGEHRLQVDYPNLASWRWKIYSLLGMKSENHLPSYLRALPYLKQGDTILTVEGKEVHSPSELQKLLGSYHGQTVSVKVARKKYPWMAPWPSYEKTVSVPTRGEYKIHLSNLLDIKFKRRIEDQVLHSASPEHQRSLNFLKINGKAPGSFQLISQNFKTSSQARILIRDKQYKGTIRSEKVGVIGFRPSSMIRPDYLNRPESFSSSLEAALRDLKNSIMVYPIFFKSLFTGRMSFLDNAAGPVRIFGVAGLILESGLRNYLYLFAAVSIALFIINLIPFPIVDGGHIVLFLYEAIVGRPFSPKVVELMYKSAFVILMILGLWIMYRDLVWLVGL